MRALYIARGRGILGGRITLPEVRARLGWGDLFLSHRIAARGSHPIAKVFAARRTGAAWGQIATEARVDADALEADVTALWPDAARILPAGAAAAAPPPRPGSGSATA